MVVTKLLATGDQVPVILFKDVPGKVNVAPEQIVPIGVNVGVKFGFTVIVIVVVVAQAPAEGVKV